MSKTVRTLCNFSIGFHPIVGVNLVQHDDTTTGFEIVIDQKSSPTTQTKESVAVTEAQVDMILRLMAEHRRAHSIGASVP